MRFEELLRSGGEHKPVRAAVADTLSLFCLPTRTHQASRTDDKRAARTHNRLSFFIAVQIIFKSLKEPGNEKLTFSALERVFCVPGMHTRCER